MYHLTPVAPRVCYCLFCTSQHIHWKWSRHPISSATNIPSQHHGGGICIVSTSVVGYWLTKVRCFDRLFGEPVMTMDAIARNGRWEVVCPPSAAANTFITLKRASVTGDGDRGDFCGCLRRGQTCRPWWWEGSSSSHVIYDGINRRRLCLSIAWHWHEHITIKWWWWDRF